MQKDYYEVLGIKKNANDKEIKKAYHSLAKKYHPDKNPGDAKAEQRFKEIGEAYEILKDSESRKKYDKYGENWKYADQFEEAQAKQGQQYAYQGDFDDFFHQYQNNGNFGGFGDFFENFFGGTHGSKSRSGGQKGYDLKGEVKISLYEAFHGTSRLIQLDKGKIKVNIKPGSYDGQQLRIKGKGGKGYNGSPHGDLYIHIQVEKDATFERNGDNLYTKLPVDIFTATLGGKIAVPTLQGEVTFSIPAGTDSAKVMRLKGKGMPKYGQSESKGDLYVTIEISVPKNISEEQRTLMEKLRDLK